MQWKLIIVSAGAFLFFIGGSVFAKGGIDFLNLPKDVWSGENVIELLQETETKTLLVKGENPSLFASLGEFHANNFPKFRVSLIAPRDLKGVVFWGSGGRVAGETFEIKKSDVPQDYIVDVWSVPTYEGILDAIGIGWTDYEGFKQEGPIEVKITSMVLEGDRSQSVFWGNIKRFFYPERLRPHSINALSGWFFGGKPFAVMWGFLFFLIAGIFIGANGIFSGVHKSYIGAVALLFLVFWGAYDTRRILDLAAIVDISWDDFVSSSRYDKTYYDLDDFHGFLNFIKDHSSKNDVVCFQALRPWPFNQGATYFLLPRKVLYEANVTKEACDIWAAYKVPRSDNAIDHIIIDGISVKPKEVFLFKGHGFVAKI